MSDHTRALVPIESWAYASPEIKINGGSVDLGLLAEALIYYDAAILNVGNRAQFAALLRLLASQDALENFIALCGSGEIVLYDYAFMTTAILGDGSYSIWNIQDPIQAQPRTFEQRYLHHPSVEEVLPKARHRQRLYRALRDRVIEVKAEEFNAAVENARANMSNPERHALIVQAAVDELYDIRKAGKPPQVSASAHKKEDGTGTTIAWNIDFNALSALGGPRLNFHTGTPLTAGAMCNRFVWSAANLNCDLFLPRPMGALVGDSLYESTASLTGPQRVVFDLQHRVEFPNIRSLVNNGLLTFNETLAIRKKAKRFRLWLQDGADRDRDAIVAYHHEVARESGLLGAARRSMAILAATGGGALGGVLGAAADGPSGAAVGGAVGSGMTYVLDVASRLGTRWRPVVFGDWLKERIDGVIARKWPHTLG